MNLAQSTMWTKGPWGIERTAEKLWVGPMRAEGGKIADIVAPIEWGRDYRPDFLAKQEANANLIAAAPELYEALEAIIAEAERMSMTRRRRAIFDNGAAALAKARGETKR